MDSQIDIVIIGAGPGGYVAAIKAAQLGMKVVVVDKRAQAGGTCLNVGCIPSKSLLHSSYKFLESKNYLKEHGILADNIRIDLRKMQARKEAIVDELVRGIGFLFRKNGVQFIQGEATIKDSHVVEVVTHDNNIITLETSKIIIATGSSSTPLENIEFDEEVILSSTGILNLSKPPKHLAVIGGGYIGLEMASVWSRLGSLVTIIEYGNHIVPQIDKEVGQVLQKTLEQQQFVFRLNKKVTNIVKHLKSVILHLLSTEQSSNNVPEIMECDAVLIAIGRRPYIHNLGLENANIVLNSKGFIEVNKNYQTSCPNIYAIGDIIGGMMLAHKAMEEGITVIEQIAEIKAEVNYKVIPSVIYTHPEVANVGKTEQELQQENISYKIGKFPFSANSRAKTVGDSSGFVKILSHSQTDRILGAHIICESAGTLIGEIAIAMEFGASAEDIARSCHAHPTLNEVIKEAAWNTFNQAIHT